MCCPPHYTLSRRKGHKKILLVPPSSEIIKVLKRMSHSASPRSRSTNVWACSKEQQAEMPQRVHSSKSRSSGHSRYVPRYSRSSRHAHTAYSKLCRLRSSSRRRSNLCLEASCSLCSSSRSQGRGENPGRPTGWPGAAAGLTQPCRKYFPRGKWKKNE